MSIRGHALVHFQSPVVTSLGRTALFGLALVSAALLGVVWRCGFSSRKVYTHPLVRLVSAHWVFIFKRCVLTPWIFACAGLSAVSNMDIYLRDPIGY